MAQARHHHAAPTVPRQDLSLEAPPVSSARTWKHQRYPACLGICERSRVFKCPLCEWPRAVPLHGPVLFADGPVRCRPYGASCSGQLRRRYALRLLLVYTALQRSICGKFSWLGYITITAPCTSKSSVKLTPWGSGSPSLWAPPAPFPGTPTFVVSKPPQLLRVRPV